MQDDVDRHHILPRAQFDRDVRPAADTLAKIAFLNGDTNKSVGAQSLDVYLAKLKAKVIDSQRNSRDKELWDVDEAEAFGAERREMLADGINDFIAECLPARNSVG